MSKPVHLYLLDIAPATERHLLSLVPSHLKLVPESGHRRISPKRRAEIGQEIEAIRVERDFMIAHLRTRHEATSRVQRSDELS